MTPHEKLNFIQNVVYELLEDESRIFSGSLVEVDIKEKLQEILFVIEQVTPTHSDDLDTVVDDYDGVHGI